MNILLIHQAFAALGEPGGTRHHELARRLAAQGHQVTVLAGRVSYMTGGETGGAAAEFTDDAGVHIIRCWTYRAWHRSFVHRVLSFTSFMASAFIAGLRVRKVDLVWGTTPPLFQGFTAWLLARLKRAAFVFEVRDLWPAFAVAVGVLRNPVLIRMSEWLEGFLYRHADRVIINSPGFRDHVVRRGARRVDLVPNGVEAAMFDPAADGAKFRRGHSWQGKYLALYAGAHGMSNNLGVVLQAAAGLQDRSDIVIVLLGDGKEKPGLMDKAEAMGLRNVCFLPPLAKAEMSEALEAADAGIAILLPLEVYKTTYPNKVFDYMAAGRPVVLAIDGAIRQVVESAGAGVFVPPGDPQAMAVAIRELADDPAAGRRMGLAGRACVEREFDRPATAQALTLSLQAALVQRGRG
jgi:glycosyltransferase involved in cell wall biosynthesis